MKWRKWWNPRVPFPPLDMALAMDQAERVRESRKPIHRAVLLILWDRHEIEAVFAHDVTARLREQGYWFARLRARSILRYLVALSLIVEERGRYALSLKGLLMIELIHDHPRA